MSFEGDLNSHLASDSAIVAQCADRIWPQNRYSDPLPAITHFIVTDDPTTNLDGEDFSLTDFRVQIDVWADSYDSARNLAALVRTRMATPAARIHSLPLPGGGGDNYEPDTKIHRVSMDFSCWYDVL